LIRGVEPVIVLSRAELADTPLSWPVTSSDVLAEGKITAFVQDQIRAPDGEKMTREYLQHPGAVGIIALDDEGRVALVRQYRHAVRHRLVEPPAGLLDVDGEGYLITAQRELAEEAGLAAATWHVLVDLFTTPGILAESLRIYLARNLTAADTPKGFARSGEEAHMDTVWASLDDVVDAVLAGELQSPSLVAGVLAAWTAKHRDDFASLRPASAEWRARDALRGDPGRAAD
jgi:8-oxo-dGDP phosphatase